MINYNMISKWRIKFNLQRIFKRIQKFKYKIEKSEKGFSCNGSVKNLTFRLFAEQQNMEQGDIKLNIAETINDTNSIDVFSQINENSSEKNLIFQNRIYPNEKIEISKFFSQFCVLWIRRETWKKTISYILSIKRSFIPLYP